MWLLARDGIGLWVLIPLLVATIGFWGARLLARETPKGFLYAMVFFAAQAVEYVGEGGRVVYSMQFGLRVDINLKDPSGFNFIDSNVLLMFFSLYCYVVLRYRIEQT